VREPSTVRHHRQRADFFYQSVQLLDLAVAYGPAVGLLAVHDGIALTDAVFASAGATTQGGTSRGRARLERWGGGLPSTRARSDGRGSLVRLLHDERDAVWVFSELAPDAPPSRRVCDLAADRLRAGLLRVGREAPPAETAYGAQALDALLTESRSLRAGQGAQGNGA
jgi:hypothetical protein